VYSSLLARSPGKALCAAPGELTTGRIGYDFPEAMLRICPGYRIADGSEPVARARRIKRRPREQRAEWLNFPEAMLTHLSVLPARRRR
uniref:hypothetical protein n=1 Tax=Klebsiella pneumoniae TaxID=573 RepID=UPI0013CF9596